MRIVSWNINSVRLRQTLLADLVAALRPDVICLQEIKTLEEYFPRQAFIDLGLPHGVVAGMKGYNGVAVMSRYPLTQPEVHRWCSRDDARHVAVSVQGPAAPVRVHCVYVPAGGDVPDPVANEKFAHKLQFLDELTHWLDQRRVAERSVLLGDLNIAPLPTDVWNHKALLDVVSHTPVEVDRLERLRASWDWVDTGRHFTGPEPRLYSWWSYRAKDWEASDRGRRLDHIWVTPDLKPGLTAAGILRMARGWAQASDHVPVWVELGPESGAGAA